MTTEEPISFIDYWDALDAAMLKFFGIDTADAGIEADRIAQAQEGGDSPQDFALWFGEKYDGCNFFADIAVFYFFIEQFYFQMVFFLTKLFCRAD